MCKAAPAASGASTKYWTEECKIRYLFSCLLCFEFINLGEFVEICFHFSRLRWFDDAQMHTQQTRLQKPYVFTVLLLKQQISGGIQAPDMVMRQMYPRLCYFGEHPALLAQTSCKLIECASLIETFWVSWVLLYDLISRSCPEELKSSFK